MKKDNGNYGIRFKTTPRDTGWFSNNESRYVVLTEQTILDLQDMVEGGIPAKDIVGLLRDSVERAARN